MQGDLASYTPLLSQVGFSPKPNEGSVAYQLAHSLLLGRVRPAFDKYD